MRKTRLVCSGHTKHPLPDRNTTVAERGGRTKKLHRLLAMAGQFSTRNRQSVHFDSTTAPDRPIRLTRRSGTTDDDSGFLNIFEAAIRPMRHDSNHQDETKKGGVMPHLSGLILPCPGFYCVAAVSGRFRAMRSPLHMDMLVTVASGSETSRLSIARASNTGTAAAACNSPFLPSQ